MQLRDLLPVLGPLLLLSVASSGITDTESGLDKTLHADQKNVETHSNNTLIKHSMYITGSTQKQTIIIEKPTNLELGCELPIASRDGPVQGAVWKHGDKLINSNLYTFNSTEIAWQTIYQTDVSDKSMFGIYTCMFSGAPEAKGEFHIEGPHVKSGNKPLVSYNRDFVVMKCDTSKHSPMAWIWYKVNGSDQVLLNTSLVPNKYNFREKHANESKLTISDLSEDDSGTYLCKAIFKVGESEGKYELNVLSYMVPFKVFIAIAAEVVVLVAVIFLYELYSKKKESQSDEKTDTEPTENLKSEESTSLEANTVRQRKT
ncbi:embigin [Bombina bombina]|uniref:embigin n=1 Tax=Bombina bombina TaxID=8345 RepID=UPI00235A49F7|nr:embigin [Bombina bombina]